MARLLVGLVCALAALAPQNAKRDKAAKAFAGEWMTSYGPMKLEAKGSSVAGEYGWSGEARVEGKLDKERKALYREIFERFYASSYYRLVKGWI